MSSSIFTVQHEKLFVLKKDVCARVFKFEEENVKLIPRTYTIELFQNFSNTYLKGVYASMSYDQEKQRITVRFKCSHPNCQKRFRIWCEKSKILVNRDVEWNVESETKECVHENSTPRSYNVSGSRRNEMMEKLETQTNTAFRRSLVQSDKISDIQKGVTSKFIKKLSLRNEMDRAGTKV